MTESAENDRTCKRVEVRDLSYGEPGRPVAYCATHTYYGNGVEPNPWPCDPETPAGRGFAVACLAHPDSTLRATTWDAVESWCDSHAEAVPHDGRWAITFRTSVGVTYRQPVSVIPPGEATP